MDNSYKTQKSAQVQTSSTRAPGQMGNRRADQVAAQAPRKPALGNYDKPPVISAFERTLEKAEGNAAYNDIFQRVNSELTKQWLVNISYCYFQAQYEYLLDSFKRNVIDYISGKLKEIPEGTPLHMKASTLLKEYTVLYEYYNSHSALLRSKGGLLDTQTDLEEFKKIQDRVNSDRTKQLRADIEVQNNAVYALQKNSNNETSKKILDVNSFASMNANFQKNVVENLEHHLFKIGSASTSFAKGLELYTQMKKEHEISVANHKYAADNFSSSTWGMAYNMIWGTK